MHSHLDDQLKKTNEKVLQKNDFRICLNLANNEIE